MSASSKILITGVSGLLGGNLAEAWRGRHRLVGVYQRHPVSIPEVETAGIDILDADGLRRLCLSHRPDVVVHCASLTNVDACETDPDLSQAVNVTGSRNVAEAASAAGAKLIYISSDSVYPGTSGGYREIDPPVPRNVYGRTKLEGEYETLRIPGALVLRTNIFGWNILSKKSLGEWVLTSLREGKPVNGFVDAEFSSIYTFDLAAVIEDAMGRGICGRYNCGCRDRVSKYDFAVLLAEAYGFPPADVQRVSIENHPFVAARGKRLSLDVSAIEAALARPMPSIRQTIAHFREDDRAGLPARLHGYAGGRPIEGPTSGNGLCPNSNEPEATQ